jgi:hypothetical protein
MASGFGESLMVARKLWLTAKLVVLPSHNRPNRACFKVALSRSAGG